MRLDEEICIIYNRITTERRMDIIPCYYMEGLKFHSLSYGQFCHRWLIIITTIVISDMGFSVNHWNLWCWIEAVIAFLTNWSTQGIDMIGLFMCSRRCCINYHAYFQWQNSVRVTEFTFRCSQGTWFVEVHFSGILLSRNTETASETGFQIPKRERK